MFYQTPEFVIGRQSAGGQGPCGCRVRRGAVLWAWVRAPHRSWSQNGVESWDPLPESEVGEVVGIGKEATAGPEVPAFGVITPSLVLSDPLVQSLIRFGLCPVSTSLACVWCPWGLCPASPPPKVRSLTWPWEPQSPGRAKGKLGGEACDVPLDLLGPRWGQNRAQDSPWEGWSRDTEWGGCRSPASPAGPQTEAAGGG